MVCLVRRFNGRGDNVDDMMMVMVMVMMTVTVTVMVVSMEMMVTLMMIAFLSNSKCCWLHETGATKYIALFMN